MTGARTPSLLTSLMKEVLVALLPRSVGIFNLPLPAWLFPWIHVIFFLVTGLYGALCSYCTVFQSDSHLSIK